MLSIKRYTELTENNQNEKYKDRDLGVGYSGITNVNVFKKKNLMCLKR